MAPPSSSLVLRPSASSRRSIVRQTWNLEGAWGCSIHKVSIDLPGLTVLQTDSDAAPPGSLGVVEIAADSADLLGCVDVKAIQFRQDDDGACKALRGRLLTSLTLSRAQQINSLAINGGGTTVVADGVLVTDAPQSRLSITHNASGDALVQIKDRVHVGELELMTSGEGQLHFLAEDGLIVGRVALLASINTGLLHVATRWIETPLLRLDVFGKRSTTLTATADDPEAIKVGKIKHRIIGEGEINIIGRGTTKIHRATVMGGDSKIDARGIVAHDASLESFCETTMITGIAPDAKTRTRGFDGTLKTELSGGETSSDAATASTPPKSPETPSFPTAEQIVPLALYANDATIVTANSATDEEAAHVKEGGYFA
ncbi:hypothetical protein ATCC90586_000147 [Pythium insidiosum]|nr:hypothetical protein ATCC90586_000147 [Pythium insidiosum]